MWVVYVSSFDKICFTGWVWKMWASLLSRFPRLPPPPPHPPHIRLQWSSKARLPRPVGMVQAVRRRWEGGKEVSCRAGKQGPATSRALISWILDARPQDKTAPNLSSWQRLPWTTPSSGSLEPDSPSHPRWAHVPCLIKFRIPCLWSRSPWPVFSKNPTRSV